MGSISNTRVPMITVDIGMAQLAMHSAYETAGAEDTALMVKALKKFYETSLVMKNDGSYEIRSFTRSLPKHRYYITIPRLTKIKRGYFYLIQIISPR